MPFIDKNRYKIFSFGKEYTINNQKCIQKIKELEEYREFIWSYKPPVFFPIFICSAFMTGIICYLIDDFNEVKSYFVLSTIVLYILVSTFYYYKIKKAIKECEE